MRRICCALATALTLAAAWTPPLVAQNPAARLNALAREQIDNLVPDSAFALLKMALEPDAGATVAERVRGYTLLGITQLLRGDRLAARAAFEQALQLDAGLGVDSLRDLQSDLLVVFSEVRQLVAPPVAAARVLPSVVLDLAADTTIDRTTGRLALRVRPGYRSRVIISVTPEGAPATVLWSDTATVEGSHVAGWSLRDGDGALAAPGRYAVRVRAVDSLNQVSPTIERTVEVSLADVDTLAHPVPPAASAFAPETLQLRRASPGVLLVGALFGGAVAALPTALGTTELNAGRSGDGTAVMVGGAVVVAGVVGFLSGHRTRAMPENARRNAELRQFHAARLAEVIRSNEQARASAPLRVRVVL